MRTGNGILHLMAVWAVALVLGGCPLVEDQSAGTVEADVRSNDGRAGGDSVQPDEEVDREWDDARQSADVSEEYVELVGLPPLAVVTDNGSGQWRDIYLLDLASKSMSPLVVVEGTGAHAANLSWSPDGSRLAYIDQGPLGGNGPDNPRLMILTIGEEVPVEVVSYLEAGIGEKSGLGSPMWDQGGQHVYMKMWTWKPPTSDRPKVTHQTHIVAVDLTSGELSEVALLATEVPTMSMALNPQTGVFALAGGYTAWARCVDENGEWHHAGDEKEGEVPCPLNRIDISTVAAPGWEPISFLDSFDPGAFGTCNGDRFAPVWSWDGSQLAFLVADCFLKVGDPFGENSFTGLAIRHTFVRRADGSFSKLTPWKLEHSEDSQTWGPVGSGLVAFIKGTPGDTNVHFDELAVANLETGDIADITPEGFEHFYEIAWRPE